MATKTRQLADYLVVGGLSDQTDDIEVRPHIKPGLLYPSYVASGTSNKLMDGTTDHSGAWGTAQSDGRKYYYTNIAGSKPIKDPRIGAHFGSQRHRFTSLQKLEQETANHGNDVFSIDGREWIRASWKPDASQTMNLAHDNYGTYINWDANSANAFIEVTGYFSEANWLQHAQGEAGAAARKFKWSIDGGSDSSDIGAMTAGNVLGGRYVNASAVYAMGVGATLGIHTLKIKAVNSFSLFWFGIELIVQDTTSTTTRSQIQIPAQNAISYGKKFSVSASTPHYNPFAFKTDGSTAWASGAHNGTSWPVGTGSSANIDTATSLGLENWKYSGNYYKPYNGGRVVKWIASDGTIKTSVTIMPPNARSIKTTAISAKANASVANDTSLPTFEAGTIDNSLSEVAKTFHYREFGNGSANGGVGISGNAYTTQGGTYPDASMVGATVDDIAYVMEDGLTSLTADDVRASQLIDIHGDGDGDGYYFTFIGTGISFNNTATAAKTYTASQNLPYGTHAVKLYRTSTTDPLLIVDGVTITCDTDTKNELNEITFHQPKMPPIPEDACIIADYMLMADYVQNTSATIGTISKGVRRSGASKDHFYDCSGAIVAMGGGNTYPWYHYGPGSHSGNTMAVTLPYFGTSFTSFAEDQSQTHTFTLDGSAVTPTEADSDETRADLFYHAVSTLGQHTKVHTLPAGGYRFAGTDVASPIHTSSHYQAFETPFLYELVGGDRNMEQTNLVVTHDGKTWDEVTRDTSYMGPNGAHVSRDGSNINATTGSNHGYLWDLYRGSDSAGQEYYTKGFAPNFANLICLEDGTYKIDGMGYTSDGSYDLAWYLKINGVTSTEGSCSGDSTRANHWSINTVVVLKRGDTVQLNFAVGAMYGSGSNGQGHDFSIHKID